MIRAVWGALAVMVAASLPAAEKPVKKWHPGIYFVGYEGHFNEPRWTNDVIGSKLTGVTLRIKWRQLETGRGVYDFAPIRTLLGRAQAAGKFLGIQVEDRSWGAAEDQGKCVPDYMLTPEFGGGQMTRTKPDGGLWCTLARWNPAAMDRYIALHQALAKEFDGHPSFAWAQGTESATSMGPQITKAQRADLASQYLRLADALGSTWKQTPWGMSLNWDTGDLPTLIDRIKAAGGGITWPDTTPTSCKDCAKTPLYDVLPTYKGTLPIAPNIEYSDLTWKQHPLRDKWDCGGHPCTWQDVIDQTITWGAQITQWPPSGFGETPETNFNFRRDLVPLADKIGWQTSTACPTNIICGPLDPLKALELRVAALEETAAAVRIRLDAMDGGTKTLGYDLRAAIDGIESRLTASARALAQ